MFELLEKAALTALGLASLTQKKGEEFVEELRERYKVSEEEGRAIVDRLQEIARQGKERSSEIAETEVRRVMERMGMVHRDEFDRLKRRVEVLEARTPAASVVEEEIGPEC